MTNQGDIYGEAGRKNCPHHRGHERHWPGDGTAVCAQGAYVFITGRREPELARAVKALGSHVTGVQGDVSNLDDLDRLFAHIQREKGTLDIVFANAGAKYTASAR